jgi:hypothetical protein
MVEDKYLSYRRAAVIGNVLEWYDFAVWGYFAGAAAVE